MPDTNQNTLPTPEPATARQRVLMTRDDHAWKRAELDTSTTEGIRRNIEALWAAMRDLADYVDGRHPAYDEPDSTKQPN